MRASTLASVAALRLAAVLARVDHRIYPGHGEAVLVVTDDRVFVRWVALGGASSPTEDVPGVDSWRSFRASRPDLASVKPILVKRVRYWTQRQPDGSTMRRRAVRGPQGLRESGGVSQVDCQRETCMAERLPDSDFCFAHVDPLG